MTIHDNGNSIAGPGKDFAKHVLLFLTGLCAASCGIWEAMGAIL